jgi:hypothetical protein
MVMSSRLTVKDCRNNRKFSGKGMAGGWSTPRPGRFIPEKRDPVPIVQGAGWAPLPVWTGVENLAPTGIRSSDRPSRSELLHRLCCLGPQNLWPLPAFDPGTVHPVASCYTDYALPAHKISGPYRPSIPEPSIP